MCNLYSITTVPEAMRELFKVSRDHDRLGNAEPAPSVFPGGTAPIVRHASDGERELVPSRFGFVLPQRSKKTGEPIQPKFVTNARQEKVRTSPFWRGSFVERRCLVPASAFCEMKGRRPSDACLVRGCRRHRPPAIRVRGALEGVLRIDPGRILVLRDTHNRHDDAQ